MRQPKTATPVAKPAGWMDMSQVESSYLIDNFRHKIVKKSIPATGSLVAAGGFLLSEHERTPGAVAVSGIYSRTPAGILSPIPAGIPRTNSFLKGMRWYRKDTRFASTA